MNRRPMTRVTVLLAIFGVAVLLAPGAAQAYINCYSYSPGGILLGPCVAGINGPPPVLSVVGYANDPVTGGETPGLQTRLVELGSGDFDAVAITFPDGSNRGAYPKGAPAKGSAEEVLQSLFLAADKIGEEGSGDGVLLIFDRGLLDGLSADGVTLDDILAVAGSARSITGYFAHR